MKKNMRHGAVVAMLVVIGLMSPETLAQIGVAVTAYFVAIWMTPIVKYITRQR